MSNNNKTYNWGDNRRYNAFTSRIKEKFGGRIQKVSVNAGFTCPNRDGTKGYGGCLYCNNESFTPSYCIEDMDILSQLDKGISFLQNRYKNIKHYVAYFQPYSNTYQTLENLKKYYSIALEHRRIDGLVISTRPDCVDQTLLDYLQDLARDYLIFIEYGIESCYNDTLLKINRCHTFDETVKAIYETSLRGLHVTGHVIFGLPGESKKDMLDEAATLSELPLSALKFHQLQIIKNTRMAEKYGEDPDSFMLFEMNEYIDFIIDFLERLNPMISVERLSSESPPRHRINPGWGNKRIDVIQKKIESVMAERDTWQGKKYQNVQAM